RRRAARLYCAPQQDRRAQRAGARSQLRSGAHAMRMLPTEFLKIKDRHGTQTRSKRKSTSRVAHMSAPLKGLSRLAQLNEADPLLASILTNFVVEQDRISLRPGYFRMGTIADGRPISTL